MKVRIQIIPLCPLTANVYYTDICLGCHASGWRGNPFRGDWLVGDEAMLDGTCSRALDWGALAQPSLGLTAASFTAVISAYIRYACYKKLGPLFTFEVSIKPGHKLIRTGPMRLSDTQHKALACLRSSLLQWPCYVGTPLFGSVFSRGFST